MKHILKKLECVTFFFFLSVVCSCDLSPLSFSPFLSLFCYMKCVWCEGRPGKKLGRERKF